MLSFFQSNSPKPLPERKPKPPTASVRYSLCTPGLSNWSHTCFSRYCDVFFPFPKWSEVCGEVWLWGGAQRRAVFLWGGCDQAEGVCWTGVGPGTGRHPHWHLPAQLRGDCWRSTSTCKWTADTGQQDRSAWWDFFSCWLTVIALCGTAWLGASFFFWTICLQRVLKQWTLELQHRQ